MNKNRINVIGGSFHTTIKVSVAFPVISAISQTSVLRFTDSVQECPRNCHGNGECVSGVCHCFPGFHGMDCSKGRRPSNLCADLCHMCTHRDWQGKAYNPLTHARVREETRLCTEEIVCSVVLEEAGITKSRARW